jgi:hypothetical protein
MARLVALIAFGVLVGSCLATSPQASPMPGVVAGACQPTPESWPMGRVGGNLAARGIPAEGMRAGHDLKVLWFLRTPREGLGLRLAVERLDGPGTGHARVTNINRAGSGEQLPDWSTAFPSNVTFDVAGCWRIRDIDGSDADAVVVEVRSN